VARLPQTWADDLDRRPQAGVPQDMIFQTKPQIALSQLRAALESGIAAVTVLTDAGYGVDTDFRDSVTELGMPYVVGIQSSIRLWPPGMKPLPPRRWSGRGRPTSLIRRDAEHQPVSAKQLALSLPKRAWRRVIWRREAMPRSPPASPRSASAPRIATTIAPPRGRRGGA
jgi:SRSO17 transposase